MLAYCGRPRSASFCDRFPYICVGYARETIAESCSIWVALATAIISQTGSKGVPPVDVIFIITIVALYALTHWIVRALSRLGDVE